MNLYQQIDQQKPLCPNTMKALLWIMVRNLTNRSRDEFAYKSRDEAFEYRVELYFENSGPCVRMNFVLHRQQPVWYQSKQANHAREQYQDLTWNEAEKSWDATWLLRPVIGEVIWQQRAEYSTHLNTAGFAFRKTTEYDQFMRTVEEIIQRFMWMGVLRVEEQEVLDRQRLEEARTYIKNERLVKAEVPLENA